MFKFLLFASILGLSWPVLADVDTEATEQDESSQPAIEIVGVSVGPVLEYTIDVQSVRKTCQPRPQEPHTFEVEPVPPESGTGPVEIEDGKAKITGYYKDGKRDGQWMYYWDGEPSLMTEYDTGKYIRTQMLSFPEDVYDDGPCEEYYEDGKLAARYAYKDNHIDGVVEEYYPNGQLKTKVTLSRGQLKGPYEEYHENGQLHLKTTMFAPYPWEWQANGPYEEYYKNGQLKEKATYQSNVRIGPYELYQENGQPIEKRDENGDYEMYYPNGQLKFKGRTTRGVHHRYSENGDHLGLKENGVYKEYYENGQLMEEMDENNLSKQYTETGRLFAECIVDGWYSCTFYEEDGTTKRVEGPGMLIED